MLVGCWTEALHVFKISNILFSEYSVKEFKVSNKENRKNTVRLTMVSVWINSSCWIRVEIWRESSPTPGSFQNGISYLVLNFSCVFQRLDKLVKWIRGYFRLSKYTPKRSITSSVILHLWLIQDICKVVSLVCFFNVHWVTISNISNQNEECHVICSMTSMSKTSHSFAPQNNTWIISSLNTSKIVRPVQSVPLPRGGGGDTCYVGVPGDVPFSWVYLYVFWSQVEYKIVCFIFARKF